jgi:hypothetical protein
VVSRNSNWQRRQGRRLVAALSLVGCLLLLPTADALADEQAEVRTLLGRGWTFMEAGDMNKADAAFADAFETQVGRNTAETYYAIAAVWWERRNAMAAYMWLSDGVKAARESYAWNGGTGQEWDRRIGGRKRFIQNNFTIAKLRAPARGRALPPLADPPAIDPVLREFADMLARVVDEGTAAKVELQWVLLPNGSYWVGDQLQHLVGGELEPTRAVSWDLVKDNRRNRRQYSAQEAAIAANDSMALKLLEQGDRLAAQAGRKEAAEAAAAEEKDRQEILRLTRRREAEKEFQRRALEEDKRKREALAEADRREASQAEVAGPVPSPAPAEAAAPAPAPADVAPAPVPAGPAPAEQTLVEKAPTPAPAGSPSPTSAPAERSPAAAEEQAKADPAPVGDQGRWAAAVEKMEEVQEAERREADEQRKTVKTQKSRRGKTPPDQDAYLARRFYVAAGGGGAGVTRMTSTATEAELQWQGHWEVGYVAPLAVSPIGPFGLSVAVSYNNLPVSGCSQQQTRGHALSLHAAPRLAMFLSGRLWLQAQAGFHVGGLATWPTATERDSCAEKRLQVDAADQVAYGARLGTAGGTARVSYEELGWRGYALTLGPDFVVGITVAPRASRLYIGAQFFVRHDQVFAVLNEGTYRYRVEAQDGLTLGQQKLDAVSGAASMGRFQFGLRGQVSF